MKHAQLLDRIDMDRLTPLVKLAGEETAQRRWLTRTRDERVPAESKIDELADRLVDRVEVAQVTMKQVAVPKRFELIEKLGGAIGARNYKAVASVALRQCNPNVAGDRAEKYYFAVHSGLTRVFPGARFARFRDCLRERGNSPALRARAEYPRCSGAARSPFQGRPPLVLAQNPRRAIAHGAATSSA